MVCSYWRKSTSWSCEKTTGRPSAASSFQSPRTKGPQSYTTSRRDKAALFSTLSSHRLPNNDIESNGNGNENGDLIEGPQLNFSGISKLIESDTEVSDASSIWYVVTTAALLGLNRQSSIGQLWKYISDQCDHDTSRMLPIARRIRESCLKSSVLVGFPHGINGLLSLQSAIEKHSHSLVPVLASDSSLRAPLTPAEKYDRGKDFFSSIYSKHTDRVLASMGRSSGGDLDYYAVSSVYGELMAETSILGAAETGILEFVCCLVADVAPQAKGHFFGCKNLGATGAQMRGTISLVGELATQLNFPPDRMPGASSQYRFLEKAQEW
ncbi:hypothetical protein FQN54_008043 [Arachnomyces sp. PD_36]|nr:hypothetical protein FQN54_008043 [Arachnomyces sp. PD_36]